MTVSHKRPGKRRKLVGPVVADSGTKQAPFEGDAPEGQPGPVGSEPFEYHVQEEISPARVQQAFSSAEAKAAEAQQLLSQGAQNAGYAREVFHATAPIYVRLAEIAPDDPQLKDYVVSGLQFANSVERRLSLTIDASRPAIAGLAATAGSMSVFCDSTGSISRALLPEYQVVAVESPPFFLHQNAAIKEKLARIDPALLSTYEEIGEAYHGTTADPERAAIAMMRQAFDHLFDRLAPDDAVRRSRYWKPKKGKTKKERNLVTRPERMAYAAHAHIRDRGKAQIILASSANVQETYKLLNRLHDRGALSKDQARLALKAMKRLIETWVEAVEL